MPLGIEATTRGLSHSPVFVGQITGTDVVKVDLSDLSDEEVDADGYIKPGVPLAKDGSIVGSGVPVWGVTIEAIKVASRRVRQIASPAIDVVRQAAATGFFPFRFGR